MADISENTPLLRSVDSEPIGERGSPNPPTPTTTDDSLRFVTTLTWLSLVLSVVVIAFDLAVNILYEGNRPGGYYLPWNLRDAVMAMGVVGLSTALISFLNLVRLYHSRQALWLWLNLICDFLIAFYSILISGSGIIPDWSYTCSPESEDCRLAQRIEICTYLTLGFGFALGVNHVVLFLLRCALAFRSRFWRGFQRWRLPAGQLTLEFTIKFLRQDGQRTEEEEGR